MNNRQPSPNVLIVYVDEMRGDCLSAAGHPDLVTPNLDHLAAGGALFEKVWWIWNAGDAIESSG